MIKKLYNKSEISFALIWIGIYVIVMNIALRFCGGFDNLANKLRINNGYGFSQRAAGRPEKFKESEENEKWKRRRRTWA